MSLGVPVWSSNLVPVCIILELLILRSLNLSTIILLIHIKKLIAMQYAHSLREATKTCDESAYNVINFKFIRDYAYALCFITMDLQNAQIR